MAIYQIKQIHIYHLLSVPLEIKLPQINGTVCEVLSLEVSAACCMWSQAELWAFSLHIGHWSWLTHTVDNLFTCKQGHHGLIIDQTTCTKLKAPVYWSVYSRGTGNTIIALNIIMRTSEPNLLRKVVHFLYSQQNYTSNLKFQHYLLHNDSP